MRVIIIGGVAGGGASCAARLRRLKILMVERGPMFLC